MKNWLGILCFGLIAICSHAQKRIELNPNITKVTVFSLGAEVTHEVPVRLSSGQSLLILKGISPFVSKGTVKINDENLTIINSKLVKKLNAIERQGLIDEKDSYETQIQVLNSSVSNLSNLESVDDFSKMLEYYDTKIRSIKKLLREVNQTLDQDTLYGEEPMLEVLVSTTSNINKEVEIKYVVGSAAWVPSYEVIVPEINTNLKLKYMAKIMNKTGEDWKDVVLSLSLNSPFDKAGTLPKLQPIYIGGTTRNPRGQNNAVRGLPKELEDLKIEGVEYVEYEAPAYTELISVGDHKTIPANGGIYTYEVFTKTLETKYIWYAFPALEEHPYLVGQVANWQNLPLIDGDAKIYLNGTNIGDSYISLDGLPDTLDIPIGQNQAILVQRDVIGNLAVKKESGNKTKVTHAFEYKIKSNTAIPTHLKVFDQVPVSQSNRIDVTVSNLSSGKRNDENGEVVWEFDLKPGEEIKGKKLIYTIEYQRGRGSNHYSAAYSSGKSMQRKVRAKF